VFEDKKKRRGRHRHVRGWSKHTQRYWPNGCFWSSQGALASLDIADGAVRQPYHHEQISGQYKNMRRRKSLENAACSERFQAWLYGARVQSSCICFICVACLFVCFVFVFDYIYNSFYVYLLFLCFSYFFVVLNCDVVMFCMFVMCLNFVFCIFFTFCVFRS